MPGREGSSVYWIDAPAAGPRPIPDSSRSGYLGWAPDGRSIYFSSNRGGATNIWKAPLERGGAVQVTTHKWSRVPAVSLDGRYPFFLKVVNADGALNLFRVPLAGGDEEKVLESVDTYNLCRVPVPKVQLVLNDWPATGWPGRFSNAVTEGVSSGGCLEAGSCWCRCCARIQSRACGQQPSGGASGPRLVFTHPQRRA
jgi:WD40-like Beta Propeller Repeat